MRMLTSTIFRLVATIVDKPSLSATRGLRNMLTPAGLSEIASYANYLAPHVRMIIPMDKDESLTKPWKSSMRAWGWPTRQQPDLPPGKQFLFTDFRNNNGASARNEEGNISEVQRYFAAYADAIFTDDPALRRRAIS